MILCTLKLSELNLLLTFFGGLIEFFFFNFCFSNFSYLRRKLSRIKNITIQNQFLSQSVGFIIELKKRRFCLRSTLTFVDSKKKLFWIIILRPIRWIQYKIINKVSPNFEIFKFFYFLCLEFWLHKNNFNLRSSKKCVYST